MCKLTKNLPIQGGVVGYSGFRGEYLTRGRGKFRGVETPVASELWVSHIYTIHLVSFHDILNIEIL